jgi:hypothetical protein
MSAQIDLRGLMALHETLALTGSEGEPLLTGEEWDACRELVPRVARRLLEQAMETPPSFGEAVARAQEHAQAAAPALMVVPNGEAKPFPPVDLGKTSEDFVSLFQRLGYSDLAGAFGKWRLPGIDSPYWVDDATIEERLQKYAAIERHGGPGTTPAQRAATVAATMPPGVNAAALTEQQVAVLRAAGLIPSVRPEPASGEKACKHCGGTTFVRLQTKTGPNTGKYFLKCDKQKGGCGEFARWA